MKVLSKSATNFVSADSEFLELASTPASYSITQPYTITFWLYIEEAQTEDIFIANGGSQGNFIVGIYEGLFGDTNLGFALWHNTGLNLHFVSSESLSPGQWYFVICEYDGDYIHISLNNGTRYSTAFPETPIASDGNFTIGGSDSLTIYSDSSISSVNLWQRILTDNEKSLLYAGQKYEDYTTLLTDLVECFPLVKEQDGVFLGKLGTELDVNGTPTEVVGPVENLAVDGCNIWRIIDGEFSGQSFYTFSTYPVFVENWRSENNAVLFDGNDYFFTEILGWQSSFSFLCVFSCNSLASARGIFGLFRPFQPGSYIRLNTNGSVAIRLASSSTTAEYVEFVSEASDVSVDTLYVLAITYNHSQQSCRMTLNGTELTLTDNSTGTITTLGMSGYLGILGAGHATTISSFYSGHLSSPMMVTNINTSEVDLLARGLASKYSITWNG